MPVSAWLMLFGTLLIYIIGFTFCFLKIKRNKEK
jgi:hypothetical protein